MGVLTFAKALEQVGKDDPGGGDVHVDSASWREAAGKRPKPKAAMSFREVVAGAGPGKLGKAEPIGISGPELVALLAKRKADGEAPRALKPMDDENSHAPFPHDPNFLGSLRPDQVPRFYGALTNPDKLEDKRVPLDSLVATQNRVNTGKAEAMRGGKRPGKPVVVRHQGRNYIADGHHGAAAAWLDGDTHADVKFKDLEGVDNAVKRGEPADFEWSITVPIDKADEDQNLVFGWASVIEENGQPTFDVQGDRISEDELEKAFYGFAEQARQAGEMHVDFGKDSHGVMVECMVFTKAKQEALGIDLGKVGAWVGFRVTPELFAKVKDGSYPAFSIGGRGRRVPV